MIPTNTLTLILAGVVLASMTAGILWIYKSGERQALVRVERQNNAAAQKSDLARDRFDRCIADGRVWDYGTSKCGRPARGSWK